jgi:hypothetical protein
MHCKCTRMFSDNLHLFRKFRLKVIEGSVTRLIVFFEKVIEPSNWGSHSFWKSFAKVATRILPSGAYSIVSGVSSSGLQMPSWSQEQYMVTINSTVNSKKNKSYALTGMLLWLLKLSVRMSMMSSASRDLRPCRPRVFCNGSKEVIKLQYKT